MNAYTSSVVISRAPEEVFQYVSVPENQPEWAINFVKSTRSVGDGRYVMDTPVGDLTYRVEVDDRCRTVDFVFETPAGDNVLPSRVVPHPAGALFTFTILRAPDQPEEAWDQGRRGLDEELMRLKELLED
jgi:uncharacterized protein YndB with AHSA1/START domain